SQTSSMSKSRRFGSNFCSCFLLVIDDAWLIINPIDRPAVLIAMTTRDDPVLDFHIPFHPCPAPLVPPVSGKRKRPFLCHRCAVNRQSDRDRQSGRRLAVASSDRRGTHMSRPIIF